MKRKWTKRASALLLALVLAVSLLPMSALAASRGLEYEVKSGDSLRLDSRDFQDLFDRETDLRGRLKYIKFTGYSELDEYGYLEVNDRSRRRLNEDSLYREDPKFYVDYNDIPTYNRDGYLLDDLRFVADSRARGTLRLEFRMVSEQGDREYDTKATMEIKVGYSSGTVDGTRLSYEVKEGDKYNVDDRDFREMFSRYTRETSIEYLEFTKTSGLDRAGVLTAKDKSGTTRELDEYRLRGVRFYRDQRDLDFYGDGYLLGSLTFEAKRGASDTVQMEFLLQGINRKYHTNGVLEFKVGRGSNDRPSHSSGRGDLNYRADDPVKGVLLDSRDFSRLFSSSKDTSGQMSYMKFTDIRELDRYGTLTARDERGITRELSTNDAKRGWFYLNRSDVKNSGDYELDDLRFVPRKDARGTLTAEFELVGDSYSNRMKGTLEIEINGGGERPAAQSLRIALDANGRATLDLGKLQRFFEEDKYASGTLRYVEFTDVLDLSRHKGVLYYNYGESTETAFNNSNLDRYRFYTTDARDGDYPLDKLTFVADSMLVGGVTLSFRAWGDGSGNYVDGKMIFEQSSSGQLPGQKPGDTTTKADIIYTTTASTPVQINANDIARFYRKALPNGELMYVRIIGLPINGSMYYNYYGASSYATTQQELLTMGNIQRRDFYYSPRSQIDYALTELTYVPSGVNNCAALPFLAVGTSGNVQGTIYISVSSKTVPEVYGAMVSGGTVDFPVDPVYSAVSSATGTPLYGIRLLKLPDPLQGRIEINGGAAGVGADTSRVYTYGPSGWLMRELRFVPAPGFTGNVEIPYAACDAQGNAVAAGKVSLGVLSKVKTFKDVNRNSTWCYKYVTELSSTGVIDGYADGTFKEKNSLTYGAALKLIMLGAGYPEQAPTVKGSPFSGYLAKAKADGLVDAKAKIDLKKPITRLQVSQIAAKALKLNVNNLNSVKPFTDTQDVYVQALNAAGIVEGYFSNGKSTFQPNATLTRGHVSAIVWRMQQYRK